MQVPAQKAAMLGSQVYWQADPVFVHAPAVLHVCGWSPEHCLAPGVQLPEQVAVLALQMYGQAVPLFCHAPVASQVWG